MSTTVLVTVPGDPQQGLEALTRALAGMAQVEPIDAPDPHDEAALAMAAAGEMLLRHATRPAVRSLTLGAARALVDRAERLGTEPAVPAGGGGATE